jgi:hypothetical protein
MKSSNTIKQIFLIALIIIIIGGVISSINFKKKIPIITEDPKSMPVVEKIEPIEICYFRSDKTTSGFYDGAWLKLNIVGKNVTGEFQNLPAESDSKVGTFSGTTETLDQATMSITANVIWQSRAEGMEVPEELILKWGDGSATAGFGEMVDRGDGTYVYKDKTNLSYIKGMSQIDCVTLDEKLFAEKYVKDNIGTIATNKPVLGGTWYVVSAIATPITHNIDITYEDGHIQSKASVTYTYQKDSQSITITKFEIKK